MIFLTIFYLILFLLILIFIVLILPYKYEYLIEYNDGFINKIYIETFIFKWKYIKYNNYSKTLISIFSFEKEYGKDKSNKKELKEIDEKASDISEKDSKNDFPYKLINKTNINHLLQFIIKIIKHIKPNNIFLNLQVSLSDPYYNGLILANYYSLKTVYPELPVNLSINWKKEVITGQGKITGNIIPIVILYYLIVFIISPRTIKILWQLYKHYK